ncbi:MAG: hypothetical protein MZV65_20875 [Chromatiales bacterium]|nr:hypothetical protein [Chromatiales bacterium]
MPANGACFYAHDQLGIPHERRIVHYSGHMEWRKGIHVIMAAAIELVEKRDRRDVHFVLVGNKDGVEQPYLEMLSTSPRDHTLRSVDTVRTFANSCSRPTSG